MTKQELENLSEEELINILKDKLESNKYEHNMYALMGSVGVSPSNMKSFSESMKVLQEVNKMKF